MRIPFVSFLLLCCLPVITLAAESEALKAQMDQYVGVWKGYFIVEAPKIDYEESFSVEQRYWWQGDVLRGVSVARREDGMKTSRSSSYIEGEQIVAEIQHGEGVDQFYGVLLDGGIVWVHADVARAKHYQMKEVMKEEAGARTMLTTGFDTFVHEGAPTHLLYRGELVQESDTGSD